MAKTQTKSSLSKVEAALVELEEAKKDFQAAIYKFRAVYDPNTVGLDYWADGLDDTMSEIEEDINSTFDR